VDSAPARNPDYKFATTVYEDYGYTNLPLIIKGGNSIGAYFAKEFTVSIVAVDSTNGRTTVDVPAAYKPYVFMGVPLNVTGGSSTGYTGEVRIHKRNLKTDGTLSGQYVLDAVVGTVGDTLNINQRTLTARTYRRDYTADALTANGSFTLRGTTMRFGYNAGSTGTRAVEFYVGGETTQSASITAYGTSIGLYASSLVFGGNIGFSATNTWNIGSSGNTVKNIYTQNAVTVVSDRDHKPVQEGIPDNILDIWGTIGIKRFKYDWAIAAKGEDAARWHVGYIAQDIIEAFEAAGRTLPNGRWLYVMNGLPRMRWLSHGMMSTKPFRRSMMSRGRRYLRKLRCWYDKQDRELPKKRYQQEVNGGLLWMSATRWRTPICAGDLSA
jgi:hypothetical protein